MREASAAQTDRIIAAPHLHHTDQVYLRAVVSAQEKRSACAMPMLKWRQLLTDW